MAKNNVGLWVCPKCDILKGIQTELHEEGILTHCINCGMNIHSDDVHFLNQKLVMKIHQKLREYIPEEYMDYVRLSWASSRTLGIIFEIDRMEVYEELNFDIHELFENEIGSELDMLITIYFE